ncbi:beclin-1-like protein [Silene latifolia]|uniref:beclin-1-like protein n=1 Tax=Silene latifolia TaxID=37657 RepID=UPI003D7763FA
MKGDNENGKKGGLGGVKAVEVDPNLPRWVCQNCRHPLSIVSVVDSFGLQGSSLHGSASVSASTHMDHSFVVLPKQKSQSPGAPPRPRSGAAQPEVSPSGKMMEESFVVLPPALASVYPPQTDGNGMHAQSAEGNPNGQLNPNSSGFHSTITVLKRAFEIATAQTQVEQPLCLECMRILSDKLDKEVEDVNRDIQAYEACLQRLEGDSQNVLSEADFLKEKLKIEDEERKLEAAIEETEKQYAKVNTELKELEMKSSRFKELEERYWHEFNNFQFQLISHQEERDAILAKIEVSQAHLELLKQTNVLDNAFSIGCDKVIKEFGTINNFRLGRLPKLQLDWDEVNAAWGLACLLLHTMCQYFSPKFHYRIKILPMGSYPRIMDTSNNTYDLFGPVNLFWSTRYDKAMTLFLTCLKDFCEFARMKDLENNIPPDKCFKLPYSIENDKLCRVEDGKVEVFSITQSFNKPETWTKALKYTLCDLKWALFWFIGNTSFQPLSTTSLADPPPAGASYVKRSIKSKSDS